MNSTLQTTLFLLAIFMFSCTSKTPQDACDCIKETANAFMLQGIQISNMDDLREPCKETIDSFKEDAAARALITDCVKEVLEAIERKELFELEGKKESFPEVTFESIEEFYSFLEAEDNNYKTHNYNIVINNAFVHTNNARIEDKCEIDAPIRYKSVSLEDDQFTPRKKSAIKTGHVVELIVTDSLSTTIAPSLDFFDGIIIDVWKGKTVPWNSELYTVSQAISEYLLGGYGIYIGRDKSVDIINTLIESCAPNFVQDAAEGRYIFMYDDNAYSYRKRKDSNNYLQLLFGGNYAMCQGKIEGVLKTYKTDTKIVLESCELKKKEMPELLNEGIVYDIIEVVNYVANEQYDVQQKRFLPDNYGFDQRDGLQ